MARRPVPVRPAFRLVKTPVRGALLVAMVALGTAAAPEAAAYIFTADAPTDASDVNPGDGICDIGIGLCSLRAALEEIAALPPAATPCLIRVVAATHTLFLGPLVVSGDVVIAPLTSGTRPVIAQAGTDSVFVVSSQSRLVARELEVRGGDAVNGGAIRADGSAGKATLELKDMFLVFNQASERGGAVFLESADAAITGGRIDSNTAGEMGGAIAAQGSYTLTVDGTRFVDNQAQFEGGALWLDLANALSSARLRQLVLQSNDGGFLGGALSAVGDADGSNGWVSVVQSLVWLNSADSGGASLAARDGAELRVRSSTITGSTSDFGTGFEMADSPGSISFSTFSNHTSTFSPAFLVLSTQMSGGEEVRMDHTVVTDSASGTDVDAFGSQIVSDGHNHIGALDPFADYVGHSTDVTGTSAAPADPMLGALADNGGGTLTHAPLPGSPLVDSGTTVLPVDPDLVYDPRGVRRCQDGLDDSVLACDRGAHELTECENGIDDDSDLVRYPGSGGIDFDPSLFGSTGDPDCGSPKDTTEAPPLCDDGVDNDEDSFVDGDDDDCRPEGPGEAKGNRCRTHAGFLVLLPILLALRRGGRLP